MSAVINHKRRYFAILYTLLFHVSLVLIFLLITLPNPVEIKPNPPLPELMMDLGLEGLGNTDAGGSGQNDPDIETSEAVATTPVITEDVPPAIVTDETETEVSEKSNPKPKPEKTAEPVVTAPPKIEEPKPSSELLSALAALKNKKKHNGKGEGDGNTGGSGTGSKQGVGDGDGTGHGNGTPGGPGSGGYELVGRLLVKKPERMTDSEEEGKVVVEIIVDETGKVIKATPGQRGSTTTSSKLFAKARQAALSAKFNPSAEGKQEQRGTYTFVFLLE